MASDAVTNVGCNSGGGVRVEKSVRTVDGFQLVWLPDACGAVHWLRCPPPFANLERGRAWLHACGGSRVVVAR